MRYMQCMHCMIHTSTSTINPTLRLLKQTDGNLSQVKQQFPVLVKKILSYFQWLKPQKLNEFGAPSFGLQRMLQFVSMICVYRWSCNILRPVSALLHWKPFATGESTWSISSWIHLLLSVLRWMMMNSMKYNRLWYEIFETRR